MVRDLAEFGMPNAVINVLKISFVTMQLLPDGSKYFTSVRIVCDGALLHFDFEFPDKSLAEAMFQFFKWCVENNA